MRRWIFGSTERRWLIGFLVLAAGVVTAVILASLLGGLTEQVAYVAAVVLLLALAIFRFVWTP